jgi:hypothetical protein
LPTPTRWSTGEPVADFFGAVAGRTARTEGVVARRGVETGRVVGAACVAGWVGAGRDGVGLGDGDAAADVDVVGRAGRVVAPGDPPAHAASAAVAAIVIAAVARRIASPAD